MGDHDPFAVGLLVDVRISEIVVDLIAAHEHFELGAGGEDGGVAEEFHIHARNVDRLVVGGILLQPVEKDLAGVDRAVGMGVNQFRGSDPFEGGEIAIDYGVGPGSVEGFDLVGVGVGAKVHGGKDDQ